MAVFRVERTKDFTVMSNHHLRNTELSLKAKGLHSLMLSLPDNWDYTMTGLACICKDGLSSIRATIQELEKHGYLFRKRIRNSKGQLTETEYTILECPVQQHSHSSPTFENQTLDNPTLANPTQDKPMEDKHTQSITNELKTNKSTTDLLITNINQSILESKMDGMDVYRQLIKENIAYDILKTQIDTTRLDGVVDLILETLCSSKKSIRVNGENIPSALVKNRLLKINNMHIEYVYECLDKSATQVKNIKSYLLTALYNAPSTIDHYYDSKINYDLNKSNEEWR
ncbi:helix-turn-helix domain-containing protein [Enterococcus plantarum]|uniref:DUF6017 domain-containing protein n=1 Tax=Enterococcus plantarum TaxID=1077675 RepID=UPI001A8D9951|nr:DUF6017 domain-containing protein [Enterococcus plantarum]MBO0468567.1 helix-turn-helix domain-containing protein [Enterococcus plantarum]